MTDPEKRSLPPEIVKVIDSALAGVESKFPGVSKDPKVRDEVNRAVEAALASLERAVPEATDAKTRRSMSRRSVFVYARAGLTPALSELVASEVASSSATRKEMERLGRAACEEAPRE